jgi:hypothetical protein
MIYFFPGLDTKTDLARNHEGKNWRGTDFLWANFGRGTSSEKNIIHFLL